MFEKQIGIDLGTVNVLVHVRGRGIVLHEPSVVAIRRDANKMVLIGHEAYDTLGRTPESIEVIRPMRDGVIVQEGTPEEIVTRPANDYVSEFVQDVSRAKVIRAGSIMREPDIVIHEGQDARAALATMRDNNAEAAYVVGDGNILKGILTQDRITDLANQRIGILEAAQTEGLATTSPATFIEKIIPLAAETEHFIAVVDDEGRLLGEIHRRALLAGMVDELPDGGLAV